MCRRYKIQCYTGKDTKKEWKDTYSPNKFPIYQLKGVKSELKTCHFEGIYNEAKTIHTHCPSVRTGNSNTNTSYINVPDIYTKMLLLECPQYGYLALLIYATSTAFSTVSHFLRLSDGQHLLGVLPHILFVDCAMSLQKCYKHTTQHQSHHKCTTYRSHRRKQLHTATRDCENQNNL
jgi:hypothetical protein